MSNVNKSIGLICGILSLVLIAGCGKTQADEDAEKRASDSKFTQEKVDAFVAASRGSWETTCSQIFSKNSWNIINVAISRDALTITVSVSTYPSQVSCGTPSTIFPKDTYKFTYSVTDTPDAKNRAKIHMVADTSSINEKSDLSFDITLSNDGKGADVALLNGTLFFGGSLQPIHPSIVKDMKAHFNRIL